MPQFYFDSDDGDRMFADDVGLECANIHVAREEAIRSLPDLAREVLPDGDRREMWVRVRDDAGVHVYKITLSLVGEWLVEPPPG